ncbi:MAG: fatty acid desaturase [Alphaproteobacteria bacterium]|nr:fatty acid desaturase [Alphaproteobacteria bacterium]
MSDVSYRATGERARQMRVLPTETLKALYRRSDAAGLLRWTIHVALLAAGGWLIHLAWGTWWLAPAWLLQGMLVMALFAPMHESAHYTAFKSRWLNDVAAFLSAAAIFNIGTYYRHFHLAHHRYTQDPARDPELIAQPEPKTIGDYLWRISAIPFWATRVYQIARFPFGKVAGLDFIHPSAWPEIVRSARLQALFYAAIAATSVATGSWIAVTCWIIPAFFGAPLLRAYLVVEHNGCTHDDNGFTNTRTTLTNPLVRLIMWNMPFHAEHHLLPNIPFHRLPDAHQALRAHMQVVTPGYVRANREVLAGLS